MWIQDRRRNRPELSGELFCSVAIKMYFSLFTLIQQQQPANFFSLLYCSRDDLILDFFDSVIRLL